MNGTSLIPQLVSHYNPAACIGFGGMGSGSHGFPNDLKQKPCAASCSMTEALLYRHVILHPDGHLQGSILHLPLSTWQQEV